MITVGGNKLSIGEFEKIVVAKEKIALSASVLERIANNHQFLVQYAKDKVIYGINTGLGPMAQFKIDESDQQQLQYNLIRSHCSGAGSFFSETLARATMLCRIGNFLQAKSGIHPQAVQLLCDMLNENIIPCIPEKGGVGASGDLVQLAHLALVMIGEGEVILDGIQMSAQEAFSKRNISPMKIHLREGLAVMNGTAAMTGIGLVNLLQAKKIFLYTLMLSSFLNEIMKSFDDHFSLELNASKYHKGQQRVSELMRELLSDSKLIRKRPDHLYHKKMEEAVFTDKVQEYYSLRCVPQILGPVYDTLYYAEEVLVNEWNSVSDNPIVDEISEMVYHGGNFHGDYISLEMDKIKMTMTKLCMLVERQLNYMLNDKLNQKLPPFINLGKLGFNFGMQGLQFTATSTTAENQTLSFPMYIHSIPNNNDNQDLVSMGTNAALLTRTVTGNTLDVVAIHTMALLQAVDCLGCQARLSTASRYWYESFRSVFAIVKDDRPLQEDLVQVKNHIMNYEIDLTF